MQINLKHKGDGYFEADVVEMGARFLVQAVTERDGTEYDDPVYWADAAIYDNQHQLVENEVLLDAILDQLNDDFQGLADEVEMDRWTAKADYLYEDY